MLVGPLVLVLYEPAIGGVRWRDSLGFLVRAGGLGVLASLWWIAPLLVHVKYGIDFLQFTEQPSSIWATNSVTESLRLMGYWTSYIGVGFGITRPFFSDGGTMLFNPFVVGASLLLPALALAGLRPRAPHQLRAVLAAAGARRRRDHDGRLPRRDAAAQRDVVGLPARVRAALRAHDEQGGAAGRGRAGGAAGSDGRPAAELSRQAARRSRSASRRSPAPASRCWRCWCSPRCR